MSASDGSSQKNFSMEISCGLYALAVKSLVEFSIIRVLYAHQHL